MIKEDAEKIIDRMTMKTINCGLNGIGMFKEEFLELENAYYLVSGRLLNDRKRFGKTPKFNGVEIIIQELVDLPMNGRV